MHSSVERENPIRDSVDQEILGKVFVEEEKKKPKKQKAKPKQGGKSRFNFPSAQYRHPHGKLKSLCPYDPCVTDTITNFPQACPPYRFLAVHVNLHNVVH